MFRTLASVDDDHQQLNKTSQGAWDTFINRCHGVE